MIIQNNEIRNKVVVNVSENPYPLYEWCVKHNYFDWDEETFDEWLDNGEDLSFFEGDPDMVRVGKEVGYFFDSGDEVFLYMFDDDCYDMAAKIVGAYCNAFESKVTRGGESYRIGTMPKGMGSAIENNWQTWKNLMYGIAWRGGAGYVYDIIDCNDFAKQIAA